MPSPNHYLTLEVSENATHDEINNSYKKLARQYHPDRNKSADATKKFQEIAAAKEVLLDAEQRKQYDAELKAERNAASASVPKPRHTARANTHETNPTTHNKENVYEAPRQSKPKPNFFTAPRGTTYERRDVNHDHINAKRAAFRSQHPKPVNVVVLDPFTFMVLSSLNYSMQSRAAQARREEAEARKVVANLLVALLLQAMIRQAVLESLTDNRHDDHRPAYRRTTFAY